MGGFDWVTFLDRHGFPIAVAVFCLSGAAAAAWAVWAAGKKAAGRIHKTVIEPVVAGHLEFLRATQKTMQSQAESLANQVSLAQAVSSAVSVNGRQIDNIHARQEQLIQTTERIEMYVTDLVTDHHSGRPPAGPGGK